MCRNAAWFNKFPKRTQGGREWEGRRAEAQNEGRSSTDLSMRKNGREDDFGGMGGGRRTLGWKLRESRDGERENFGFWILGFGWGRSLDVVDVDGAREGGGGGGEEEDDHQCSM